MKYFRNTLLLLTSLFMIGVFVAPSVSAVDVLTPVCGSDTATGSSPEVCKDNQTNASNDQNPLVGKDGIITKAIQIIMLVLGVAAIFVLLINAVRLITGGSDPNSVSSARNGIIYAAVGLVIAASGQVIVTFVLSKL